MEKLPLQSLLQRSLSLLIFKNGKKIGFEIKYSDAPTRTRSMTTAQKDLNLDKLFVIYPGKLTYPLDKKIQAVGVRDICNIF